MGAPLTTTTNDATRIDREATRNLSGSGGRRARGWAPRAPALGARVYERGNKNGHTFDNRAAYILHVIDGMVTEAWTLDLDRDAALAFWEAVGTGPDSLNRAGTTP